MGKVVIPSTVVVKLREMYYYEGRSYQKIADAYGISVTAARNAILGKGWMYSMTPDNIPEEVKEARRRGTKTNKTAHT